MNNCPLTGQSDDWPARCFVPVESLVKRSVLAIDFVAVGGVESGRRLLLSTFPCADFISCVELIWVGPVASTGVL